MSKASKQRKIYYAKMAEARGEINAVRAELEEAYAYFNSITDPDLIESCVYELSALHARYNSAFKKAKELN